MLPQYYPDNAKTDMWSDNPDMDENLINPLGNPLP